MMTDITQLIQSGSANAWFYVPVAILLGALHGLEPGHSKTMMAAFIIAIRGTIAQAVLLGLSAALSHSLLIWLLAGLALTYGSRWNAESLEPILQIVSAVMILGLAVWMYLRTRREIREAHSHEHGGGATHGHPQPRLEKKAAPPSPVTSTSLPSPGKSDEPDQWQQAAHSHGTPASSPPTRAGEAITAGGLILPSGMASSSPAPGLLVSSDAPAPTRTMRQGEHGGMLLDTGHGWLEVSIFETDAPPRFRIYPCKSSGQPVPLPKGTQVAIETARLDGRTQKFAFEAKDGFWEATSQLPEPHEFLAVVSLGHADHAHTYRLRFTEDHHGHNHGDTRTPMAIVQEIEEDGLGYQDAHERAHAEDIAKRFGDRAVTTPQIVLFGITGGLMPCPAAFTILLICLQLKRVALGFTIVGAFSFGLALTMVSVGAMAAWSVQHAQKRFSGFGEVMRKAPYVSCALLTLLAIYMAYSGWHGLAGPHTH
jgi:ABC-type nickel/cobalt efflux system permease component RcnA